jgi:hypothetical protein
MPLKVGYNPAMNKTSLVQAGCWSLVASFLVAGGVAVWVLGEQFGRHMGLELLALYSGALVVSGAMMFYKKMRRRASTLATATNDGPTLSATRV